MYDLAKNAVVWELTDYAAYLIDSKQLSELTVALWLGHLKRFWAFMQPRGVTVSGIQDNTLRAFRDSELNAVLARDSSLGIERVAKRTVNQKLTAVYQWLLWMQEAARVPSNMIGPHGCQVLAYEKTAGYKGARKTTWNFPLRYRLTGASSKHRLGLSLGRQIFERACESIADGANSFVAQRDLLIMDISTEVGLRRASINSLTIDQFERSTLERVRGETIDIRPASQKFSYNNDFAFPVLLALRIADFIEGPRADLLAQKPKMQGRTKERVFISARTCTPLTNRALTQSVSRQLRVAGAGKGAGLHAGRRLFANEQIDLEVDRRLALGLDTSTASICIAVAMKMGHANPMSLYAYVSAAQSRRGLGELVNHRAEIAQLKELVRKYEKQLAQRSKDNELDLPH
ncbi:site-specific recombinase XerD [Variovorax boronicumulans]|uniref:hypothetical protein n=1 Tax=Variovorax boronicumulans TaxID=436515 RepID=UPI002781D5E4|nr:hypothetical protein [Variovorax boronicumulans]MDQ0086048.1 site-specific recombinase XerD [Variovorax boronicumulans]